MELGILWQEPAPVPAHALAAILAFALGMVQLGTVQGGRAHRTLGRVWVGLTGFVAASGLFIHEGRTLGPFSVIHVLSVTSLFGLVMGMRAARAGRIMAHRAYMLILLWAGLGLAGALALLPGRTLHRVLFGG